MSGTLPLAGDFLATLPVAFLDFYRRRFQGTRMIYGHWSGGLYTRVRGSFHRQVAVITPVELDEAVERYLDARTRRVGGAMPGLWEIVEAHKSEVRVQVAGHVPFHQDLAGHTPGRDVNSVALAVMCGQGVRVNDLRPTEPLPRQIRALAHLIAEVCVAVGSPVERFLTGSEAADNLDLPAAEDVALPHPPHGFRTTREAWDLEVWVAPSDLAVHPPVLPRQADWLRLGDWLRQEALRTLMRLTRQEWMPQGGVAPPA